MQYIEKSIEDEHTGADVKFHLICGYSVDITNNNSTITVASYISRRTFEAGKEPVGQPVVITLNAAPPADSHPLDWFNQWLVQAPPEDFMEPSNPYYGYVSPYKFSGGKLKTIDTAQASNPTTT